MNEMVAMIEDDHGKPIRVWPTLLDGSKVSHNKRYLPDKALQNSEWAALMSWT